MDFYGDQHFKSWSHISGPETIFTKLTDVLAVAVFVKFIARIISNARQYNARHDLLPFVLRQSLFLFTLRQPGDISNCRWRIDKFSSYGIREFNIMVMFTWNRRYSVQGPIPHEDIYMRKEMSDPSSTQGRKLYDLATSIAKITIGNGLLMWKWKLWPEIWFSLSWWKYFGQFGNRKQNVIC